MSVGSYAQSELNTSVTAKVSGTFTAANFLTVANAAVREVLADVDLRGTIRSAALSPNLFDEIWEYSCPSDLKGDKIIDIRPQINRGRHDNWTLTTQEEFDRVKNEYRVDQWGDPINLTNSQWTGKNFVAIQRDDLVNKLLLSRPVDDEETLISTLDSLTAGGGTWTLYGDGTNLTADTTNYVKGNGSINWDISSAGGTTAGIYNSDIDDIDISDYVTAGSVFVWAYITSATNVTNFILRIGSSASAYHAITITTNNEGASFYAGWNLLRFDFANKSDTGTPTDTATNYVALYMTKDAAKVSETDYRFDNLVLKLGKQQQVVYYSRYGWQSSTGTHLEDATATTDLLNAETDAIPLIEAKTAQRISEHLGNHKEADRFIKEYELLRARYLQNNPSQALPLIQNYQDVEA